MGQQIEVQLPGGHVGIQPGPGSPRIAQLDTAARDGPVEDVCDEVALCRENVFPVGNSRDSAGELTRQDWPAECLGQQRHADGLEVCVEIQLGIRGAPLSDGECVHDQRAIEYRQARIGCEREILSMGGKAHLDRTAHQSVGAAAAPGEL